MPPSVEYLRRIALAAAMVDEFEWNTQNTNKQLLASNYSTFWSLVVCENFNPKMDPLLSSSMQQASCKCEMPRFELKRSHTSFLAIKRCHRTKFEKVIKLTWSFGRGLTLSRFSSQTTVSWAIGPLNKEFPSHSCLAHSFSAVFCSNVLVRHPNGLPWNILLDNVIKQGTAKSIRIHFHKWVVILKYRTV